MCSFMNEILTVHSLMIIDKIESPKYIDFIDRIMLHVDILY